VRSTSSRYKSVNTQSSDVFLGKPEENRSLVRPRHRWNENIKIDLKEIGFKGVRWIRLLQDRRQLRFFCEHDSEPWGSTREWEFLE
jgi:hypothetical protein